MQKLSADALCRPSAEEFAIRSKMPVVVILDSIRSLNNVGSFFRTCDAFAVEGLALCGITASPPNREIHKTALGAELVVPWIQFPDAVQAVTHYRALGYAIYAVEQVTDSVFLNDFVPDPDARYAIVFGNEVFGVAQQVVDMCDGALEIPQAGTKHSLNVAVAGGVVLWQFFTCLGDH